MKTVMILLSALVVLLLMLAWTYNKRDAQLERQNTQLRTAVDALRDNYTLTATTLNDMVTFHNLTMATVQSNVVAHRYPFTDLPRRPDLNKVNDNVDELNRLLLQLREQ